jgi:hypothetical protein
MFRVVQVILKLFQAMLLGSTEKYQFIYGDVWDVTFLNIDRKQANYIQETRSPSLLNNDSTCILTAYRISYSCLQTKF